MNRWGPGQRDPRHTPHLLARSPDPFFFMTGQKQKSTPVWCINKFKKQLFLTPVCVFRLFPAGGSGGVQGGGRAGAGPPPPRLRRPWRRLPRPPPIVLAVAVVVRYYSDGRLWSNGTCFFCRPGPPRPSSAAASSSPSLQRGCIYIYIAIKRIYILF